MYFILIIVKFKSLLFMYFGIPDVLKVIDFVYFYPPYLYVLKAKQVFMFVCPLVLEHPLMGCFIPVFFAIFSKFLFQNILNRRTDFQMTVKALLLFLNRT